MLVTDRSDPDAQPDSLNPPAGAELLASVARLLCERVELPPETVPAAGVGALPSRAEQARQPDLFMARCPERRLTNCKPDAAQTSAQTTSDESWARRGPNLLRQRRHVGARPLSCLSSATSCPPAGAPVTPARPLRPGGDGGGHSSGEAVWARILAAPAVRPFSCLLPGAAGSLNAAMDQGVA